MRICSLKEDKSARRVSERSWVGMLLEVSQDFARRGKPVLADVGEDLRDCLVSLGTRAKRFECIDVKTVVLTAPTIKRHESGVLQQE
jgi:hypothetical protein